MGHSVIGGMQRLNIEAARRQAGQDLLQTPNPALLPQSSGGGGTPISLSTPDILNSLIAITNPFFDSAPTSSENAHNGCSSMEVEEPPEKKVFANLETPATTAAAIIASTLSSSSSLTASSTLSQSSTSHLPSLSNHHVGGSNIPASIQLSQPLPSMSQVVSSTASCGLPSISSAGPQSLLGVQLSQFPQTSSSSSGAVVPSQQLSLAPVPVTPVSSVQSMRSQLIKEGLKLTIQTKRKKSGKEELDVKSELVAKRPKREEVELTSLLDFSISNDSNESISQQQPTTTKLTPEDEERRRRRRERNKVAATKCRNKKKEKTFLLVKESEVLETENITLKSEISKLEEEYQRLSALLASHTPNCLMNLTGHQNLQNPKSSSNSTTTMSSLNGSTSSNNNNASHNNNNHSSAIGGEMPYSAIATATTISSNTEMDDNDDKYGDSLFTSISSSSHQHHLHHSNHHNILQHNNNNNTTANHFVGGGSAINNSGGNSSSNIPMKFDYFQQINYNQPIQLS